MRAILTYMFCGLSLTKHASVDALRPSSCNHLSVAVRGAASLFFKGVSFKWLELGSPPESSLQRASLRLRHVKESTFLCFGPGLSAFVVAGFLPTAIVMPIIELRVSCFLATPLSLVAIHQHQA